MLSRFSRCVHVAQRLSSDRGQNAWKAISCGGFVIDNSSVNFQGNTRRFCHESEAAKLKKDFFHICGMGDVEQARKMLADGWNVTDRDKTDATALIWAATEGHLPMVKFLIEKGANLNAKNNIGSTALWYAIWKGHKDVAVYLKDAGADINITDVDGNSLLHLAADEGKIEYVKLLLEWGVDMHIINWDGFLAKDLAQDKQVREMLHKDIDFTYY